MIFSLLLISSQASGVTFVNHFTSQFAGEIGLISFGVGKEFNRYSIGGMYGIVPTELSGGPLIETVTLRQTIKLLYWRRLSFYFGLNVFHVLGIHYRTNDYGDVPDRYYPLGSIRALLNLGIATALNNRESQFIYFEAGLNDIALINYYNNNEVIDVRNEISLAIGFRQHF